MGKIKEFWGRITARLAKLKQRAALYWHRFLRAMRVVRLEHWFLCVILVGAAAASWGVSSGGFHLYAGDVDDGSNRLYLLSALIQALAAILALAVTATLVATQLAVQSFTPRVVNYRLRDPWFWGVVGIYLAAITAASAGIAWVKPIRAAAAWNTWFMDVTLILCGAALLYLVPFTLAVMRSLEVENFIGFLLERKDYRALEDLMRRAMHEGLVRKLNTAVHMLEFHARIEMAENGGAPLKASEFTEFALRMGRYAGVRNDPEAFLVVMGFLTALTGFCTQRIFRGAADVFNEAVDELTRISEESFPQ